MSSHSGHPDAPPDAEDTAALYSQPVRNLVRHAPVTVRPQTPIVEAAQLMRDRHVSSVVLTDESGQVEGLLTDRDLRNRVVADGVDTARPVRDVATRAPRTLQHDRPALDAMLMMVRHAIHHVPVVEGNRIIGVITQTSLSSSQNLSAVALARAMRQADSVAGLQAVCERVVPLQRLLAANHATAYHTGHMLSAVTDSLTRRLIDLAEAELGPAPVPWVWVAAGSQGRQEQTARTDQDNCLVIDNAFDPERHGAWFEQFSARVCAGLDACGYVFCPGGMMAQNPPWRLPVRDWVALFQNWIETPDPTALMLTSVFFDQRAVHGHTALLDTLRHTVLERTKGNRLFLAHLARNALLHRPALGLFGRLKTAREGSRRGTIDMKMGAIVPIIDLARVYALAAGIEAVNTDDRLAAAAGQGEISARNAQDLRDALEFLGGLRLQSQAAQSANGKHPDNDLTVAALSNFKRNRMREALRVIRSLHEVIERRYAA